MGRLECTVSFKKHNGDIDCRAVFLNKTSVQQHWYDDARLALYEQHDIAGATVTNIRINQTQGVKQ